MNDFNEGENDHLPNAENVVQELTPAKRLSDDFDPECEANVSATKMKSVKMEKV